MVSEKANQQNHKMHKLGVGTKKYLCGLAILYWNQLVAEILRFLFHVHVCAFVCLFALCFFFFCLSFYMFCCKYTGSQKYVPVVNEKFSSCSPISLASSSCHSDFGCDVTWAGQDMRSTRSGDVPVQVMFKLIGWKGGKRYTHEHKRLKVIEYRISWFCCPLSQRENDLAFVHMHTEQVKRSNLNERPVMSSTTHWRYIWSDAKHKQLGNEEVPPRCPLCYRLDVLEVR